MGLGQLVHQGQAVFDAFDKESRRQGIGQLCTGGNDAHTLQPGGGLARFGVEGVGVAFALVHKMLVVIAGSSQGLIVQG